MWKPKRYRRKLRLPRWLEGSVIRRDRGVCAVCHTDTQALHEALSYVFDHCERGTRWKWWPLEFEAFKHSVGVRANKFPKRLFEIDHIVPVEEGGKNLMSNLQTLCNLCHLRKHGKTKTLVQIPLE